jgi:hypothetical protein
MLVVLLSLIGSNVIASETYSSLECKGKGKDRVCHVVKKDKISSDITYGIDGAL